MANEANPRNRASPPLVGDALNALIVGETGAGKSAIFNLLVELDAAMVNDSPEGVTAEVQYLRIQEGDVCYKFYDTAGLSEAAHGTAPGFMPKALLETVLTQRSAPGGEGISAFLMVMKEGPVTISTSSCYKYLHSLRGCDATAVPIIAVITHLDYDLPTERAQAIATAFIKCNMQFAAIVPACAANLEKFELSQQMSIVKRRNDTRKLIFEALKTHALKKGWKPKSWLSAHGRKILTLSVVSIAFASGLVLRMAK